MKMTIPFQSPSYYLLLILLLGYIYRASCGTISSISVNISHNYVGANNSNYLFTLSGFSTPIPNDGYIQIIFAITYTIPKQLFLVPIQGINSSAILNIDGQNIEIHNGSTYGSILQFGLAPWSNQSGIMVFDNNTDFILVRTFNGNQTLIDLNSITQVNILPAPITNYSFISGSPNTLDITNLTISFIPINTLPKYSIIKIKIPIFNPYAPQSMQVNSIISVRKCIPLAGINQTNNCYFENNTYITIVFPFDSGPFAPANITILVSDFRNPQSLAPLSGFEIYIFSTTGGCIDQLLNGELQVEDATDINTVKYYSTNTSVLQLTNMTFQIYPTYFINPNSSIEIFFPHDFDLRDSPTLSVIGIRNIQQGIMDINMQPDYIELKNCIPNYFQNDYIELAIYNVINIDYALSNESFIIAIRDQEGYLVSRLNSGIMYISTTGLILIEKLQPSSYKINDMTNYLFEMKVTTTLTYGDLIVTFPVEISIEDVPNDGCNYIYGINQYAWCQSINSSSVLIGQLFPLTTSNNTLAFQINNIKNSNTTQSTSSFYITANIGRKIVDETKTPMKLTFSPGYASVLQISATMPKAQLVTNLYIKFKLPDPLDPGGIINLSFDSNLVFIPGLDEYCKPLSNIDAEIQCSYNQSTNILSLFNMFKNNKVIVGISSHLLIYGFQAPRYSGTFNAPAINSVSGNGFVIDINNFTSCMLKISPNTISNIQIQPSNFLYNQLANYTINLLLDTNLNPNDQIFIKLPNYLNISTMSIIAFLSVNQGDMNSFTIGMNLIQNSLNFTLVSSIQSGSSLAISLLNILNPNLIILFYNMNFNITFYTLLNQQIATNIASLNFTTNVGSTQPNIIMTPAVNFVGEITSYNVTISSLTNIPAEGSIILQLPKEIPALVIGCTVIAGLPLTSECMTMGNNRFLITGFNQNIVSTTVTLLFANLSNPFFNSPNGFNVSVITQDGYLYTLATYTQAIKLRFSCADNCSSCYANYSNCISCNPNYYLLPDNTCQAQCPSQNYIPYQGKCILCQVDSCMVCNDTNRCLQCQIGTLLLSNNTCTANGCPANNSVYQNACIPCSLSNCLSCQQANYCSECQAGYFLLNGICLLQCPNYYTPIQNQCISCQIPYCSSCQSENQCNQCKPGYILSSINSTCSMIWPFASNNTIILYDSSSIMDQYPIVSIYCGICLIIVMISYCLYKETKIISSILVLWSMIEMFTFGYLIYRLYYFENLTTFVLFSVLVGILVLIQVIAAVILILELKKDTQYQLYKLEYKVIMTIQEILLMGNFKVIFILDSYFFRYFTFGIDLTNKLAILQKLKKIIVFDISAFLMIGIMISLNVILYVEFKLIIPLFLYEFIGLYFAEIILMCIEVCILEMAIYSEELYQEKANESKTTTQRIPNKMANENSYSISKGNSQISFLNNGDDDNSRRKLHFDDINTKNKSILDLSQIPEDQSNHSIEIQTNKIREIDKSKHDIDIEDDLNDIEIFINNNKKLYPYSENPKKDSLFFDHHRWLYTEIDSSYDKLDINAFMDDKDNDKRPDGVFSLKDPSIFSNSITNTMRSKTKPDDITTNYSPHQFNFYPKMSKEKLIKSPKKTYDGSALENLEINDNDLQLSTNQLVINDRFSLRTEDNPTILSSNINTLHKEPLSKSHTIIIPQDKPSIKLDKHSIKLDKLSTKMLDQSSTKLDRPTTNFDQPSTKLDQPSFTNINLTHNQPQLSLNNKEQLVNVSASGNNMDIRSLDNNNNSDTLLASMLVNKDGHIMIIDPDTGYPANYLTRDLLSEEVKKLKRFLRSKHNLQGVDINQLQLTDNTNNISILPGVNINNAIKGFSSTYSHENLENNSQTMTSTSIIREKEKILVKKKNEKTEVKQSFITSAIRQGLLYLKRNSSTQKSFSPDKRIKHINDDKEDQRDNEMPHSTPREQNSSTNFKKNL